jgi:hypothetical protein
MRGMFRRFRMVQSREFAGIITVREGRLVDLSHAIHNGGAHAVICRAAVDVIVTTIRRPSNRGEKVFTAVR